MIEEKVDSGKESNRCQVREKASHANFISGRSQS